jgi:MFS family permease
MDLWHRMLGAGPLLIGYVQAFFALAWQSPSFWIAAVAGLVCGIGSSVNRQSLALKEVLSAARADLRIVREEVETLRSEVSSISWPGPQLDE